MDNSLQLTMGKEQDAFVKKQLEIANTGGRPSMNFPGLEKKHRRKLNNAWKIYLGNTELTGDDLFEGKEKHSSPIPPDYYSQGRK